MNDNLTTQAVNQIQSACEACVPLEHHEPIAAPLKNWRAIAEKYVRMEAALKFIKENCAAITQEHLEANNALAFDPLSHG